MIKYCIFDLDGTLFNTLTTITHYVNLILTRHGIPAISEEECCSFIGHGAKYLIRRALASKGIVDNELGYRLLDEYNAEYNANTLYLTEPYGGIPELIHALREGGFALGVLSNKPDYTTKSIVGTFCEDCFDDVRGGREGVALKPSPEALLAMASDAGVEMSEIAYIGDTPVDIETGKAAGAAVTVGVSWGFRSREELVAAGAELIVDTPAELLREVLSRA